MAYRNTLADLIAETADLTILKTMLEVTGLGALLREPGPHTVFAPTDAAFARLDPAALAALRADLPRLREVLSDHLIPGSLLAADLMDLPAVTARSGAQLALSSADGLRVAQSYLTEANRCAANGVLHTIDRPLLPG